jgi:hypothetical protein
MHFLDGGNSGKRMYVGLFMNPIANNKELAFVFFFSFFLFSKYNKIDNVYSVYDFLIKIN